MMDGQNYHVLQSTDQYGNVSEFYVNAKTNEVEKQVGDMVNMMGEKEPMYMTFKNYEMKDGILIATDVAQYKEDGTLIMEGKLKSLTNNAGIPEDAFVADEMTMKQ